jgi:hypothetical protein
MRHIKRGIVPNTAKPSASTSPTTPPQAVRSASIVFGIFELIENILLRLPLEEIVLISNTCNSARLVVENSKPIINRFKTLNGGYQTKAGLVQGDSWSNDISFAFRFDLHPSFTVFVAQNGEHEAIAVLDRSGTGRMKIVNGVNTRITFTRPAWNEWKVGIYDAETGQTMTGYIDSYSFYWCQANLQRYLIRFHGGSDYEDCDDILMMGRLVRGRVHL